jgi:hypothetical protein
MKVRNLLVVVLGVTGLLPSMAQAQKFIDFESTGSVRSTLVFDNQIVPDVYSFFARTGEPIRVETSDNGPETNRLDTTIRVIGPDAAINLFDDDGAPNLASRLSFTAADTGAYIIVVSSFSGNPLRGGANGGNYTLNFARGTSASALQAQDALIVEPGQGEFMPEVSNPEEVKPAQ